MPAVVRLISPVGKGKPAPYSIEPAPCGAFDELALEVTSQGKKPRRHKVRLDALGWHCDCADAKYGAVKQQRPCKHVAAALDMVEASEVIMAATKKAASDEPRRQAEPAAPAGGETKAETRQPATPAPAPAQAVVIGRAEPPDHLADEQVALIKRTICAGASDDELQLFLMQCNRTRLDPFSRQIHAVRRWNAKERREVMTIQVGIDGFRLVADRTGETDGQDGPFWCGDDGVWKDVWLSSKPPVAAKVIAYRKGRNRPFVGIAHWAEYKQEFFDKTAQSWKLTPFWLRMPAGQLAKCAEALALRKAFPAELSGLYAPEELRDDPKDDEPQPTAPVIAQAQYVAGSEPTAPALPAPQTNGTAARKPSAVDAEPTVWQQAVAFEARLVERGWCKAGELQARLKADAMLALTWGKPAEDWLDDAQKHVEAECRAFAREKCDRGAVPDQE